jgi:transcriptional regulator with XRE-family HTH domain
VPRRKQRGIPDLGERIASLMEALSLNASELSARTGISVSYLTRILRGEVVNPTIDFVSRLAAGLGVTETQLLRDDAAGQASGQGQQAISALIPTLAHPALDLSHSVLDAAFEQIEADIEPRHLSKEQLERLAAGLIEANRLLANMIKPEHEKSKEG